MHHHRRTSLLESARAALATVVARLDTLPPRSLEAPPAEMDIIALDMETAIVLLYHYDTIYYANTRR